MSDFSVSNYKAILLARAQFLLALVGVFVTWVLSFGHVTHLSLPCGNHSGCDAIALSPASRFIGIPVAYIGFGAYLLFTTIAGHRLKTGSGKWQSSGYVLAIVGTIISMGFTYYSIKILEAKCLWCVTSNVIIALIALCYGLYDQRNTEIRTVWSREKRGVYLLTSILLLSMGWSSTKMVYDANRPRWDIVAFQQTPVEEFAPTDSIRFGSDDSNTTFVAFIDMRCPHCQRLVKELSDLSIEGKFEVIIRHFPLESHPGAFELAVVTETVAQKANGYEFVMEAFKNEYDTLENYLELARRFGVDIDDPHNDVEAMTKVGRDLALAKRLKLEYTPTIVVIDRDTESSILTYFQFRKVMSSMIQTD